MNINKLAKFIVLEGIDGSGKSTQCQLLHEAFNAHNLAHLITREPTDMPIGTFIRSSITNLSDSPNTLTPDALTLLFASDRTEHIEHCIKPALNTGHYVICDRYLFSSYAYQSYYSAPELIACANNHLPMPDILIYLNISLDEGQKRYETRHQTQHEKLYIFERRKIQQHTITEYTKLLKTYKNNTLTSPAYIIEIDGSQEPYIIHAQIIMHLNNYYNIQLPILHAHAKLQSLYAL